MFVLKFFGIKISIILERTGSTTTYMVMDNHSQTVFVISHQHFVIF